jgi:hypothetical protein
MAINVTPIPRLTVLAAPAFTLGTTNAAGDAITAVASNSTLLAFDATLPDAITFGQSGTVGSATVSSRRDHAHATESVTVASQVEMKAASSITAFTTPGRTQYHPGVAKAWCYIDSTGALVAGSYNIDTITDNGPGDRTVVIDVDFADTLYNILMSGANSQPAAHYAYLNKAVDDFGLKTYNNAATPSLDDRDGGITLFGDQ